MRTTGWAARGLCPQRGTALIVAELRVGADAVAAALLHACLGDAPDFDAAFGTAARLARGVAAMARIETLASSVTDKRVDPHAHLEALRQMVLAMVADIRVVLIKLAERTHALRCAASKDAVMREMLGQQARELFAPLANRLGVWQIKWEMEDWAFRYLEPDTYKSIARQLEEKRADREAISRASSNACRPSLRARHRGEISGRPKHIASIVNKMRASADFEQLYDIRAVRVLVKHEIDCSPCWACAQPVAADSWRVRRLYLAPKSNDYDRAYCGDRPEDRALECRSALRHAPQCELGLPRMALQGRRQAGCAVRGKIAWLRRILEWKDDVADSSEFTEQFKTELFHDQVYVLTPQGRVVALDRGATPVDFAYALHTDLGHRCRGAKINGAMVPLSTALENGQRVEIIAAKEGEPTALADLRANCHPRARSKVRARFRHATSVNRSASPPPAGKELNAWAWWLRPGKTRSAPQVRQVEEFHAASDAATRPRDQVNALRKPQNTAGGAPTANPGFAPNHAIRLPFRGWATLPLTLARPANRAADTIAAYTTSGAVLRAPRDAPRSRAPTLRACAAEWVSTQVRVRRDIRLKPLTRRAAARYFRRQRQGPLDSARQYRSAANCTHSSPCESRSCNSCRAYWRACSTCRLIEVGRS